MKNLSLSISFACCIASAQNIDISNFYYRDFLDFGQNKGIFKNGGLELTGKDGTKLKFPNAPSFSASSNYGSLTHVGRGFVATANHVSSPIDIAELRKFGLSDYNIANQNVGNINGISKPYGRDSKFLRLNKYIVEGEVDMLDITNTTTSSSQQNEATNLEKFKSELDKLKDSDGNLYLYQAGSGVIKLRNAQKSLMQTNSSQSGQSKGGGFGTLNYEAIKYGDLVTCDDCQTGDSRGIVFNYVPDKKFNNRITNGDSGSGIYAYDSSSKKWLLLGVVSQSLEHLGLNEAKISYVSQKDLDDYRKNFEQNIALNQSQNYTMNNSGLIDDESFTQNKDIVFSGGGTIEVKGNIYRNISGYAGGFVFSDANSSTTYKFINENGYLFDGSGLDIGKNVTVEWALRNKSGESLHKVGAGTLIVKTAYTPTAKENLGYLKVGEGKVELESDKKAFEGIYITSGRGSVVLKEGRGEAIGATKNGTNSYTLSQSSAKEMGFYFGKNGGKFDLNGNSLHLNTIAANDNRAVVTNSSANAVNLQIDGFGYSADNEKTTQKADTIIHASIGENLNLITKSTAKTNKSLIFDGDINIKGKLEANNSNIVLQGHPTAHATISDDETVAKIKTAESATKKAMADYMDLRKPSNLHQPDWDERNFSINGGIKLTNSTLTLGKAAKLKADINATNNSQINFGAKHFIDESDTKNIWGGGFGYSQVVKSGDLKDDESYENSSYSGTIVADGGKIDSQFSNFAPNLELLGGATLSAKYLTLNRENHLNFQGSTAQIENLVIRELSDLNGKVTLDGASKLEVQKGLVFDSSTFNLGSLQNLGSNSITLAPNHNLTLLNGSNVDVNDYSNSGENAKILVSNSTLKANKMNFDKNAKMLLDKGTLNLSGDFVAKDLNLTLTNSSKFKANSLQSTNKSDIVIDKGSVLKTAGDIELAKAKISLNGENSSLEARNLTFTDSSNIVLKERAKVTLQELKAKNLSLTLANSTKFSAKTLNISDGLNLNVDENSSIVATTLELNNINNANIGRNVAFSSLNLNQSNAQIAALSNSQNVALKNSSTLQIDELNFNQSANLSSDESSKAEVKRAKFDANEGLNLAKSNLIVSKSLTLKNVGKNLGTTTNKDEALKKDMLAFNFAKDLTLQNDAKVNVDFANIVKRDNANLQFDKFYEIFQARNLNGANSQVKLNLNGTNNNFYAQGKFENNRYLVLFRKQDPRNFEELNPHLKNRANKPLLELLLQHNKNDESIEKAVNESSYDKLNERLERINRDFETLAKSDELVLKILPLLQKQQISLRIDENRFGRAKGGEQNSSAQSNEPENRVFTNAASSHFTDKEAKFNLQTLSIGYDKNIFDDFLLGIIASASSATLSSDEMKFKPKIYSISLYSNAILSDGELQNELNFSSLSGDKTIAEATGRQKGKTLFFETLYKFGHKSFKPLVLARINSNKMDEFCAGEYRQKGANDLSLDLGLGGQMIWQKESGFYSATLTAERDIFHTQKNVDLTLTNAQKLISYKTNEPSFSFNLYASGIENFTNGIFLRYGISAFIDTNSYKGIKGDLQVGYRF